MVGKFQDTGLLTIPALKVLFPASGIIIIYKLCRTTNTSETLQNLKESKKFLLMTFSFSKNIIHLLFAPTDN